MAQLVLLGISITDRFKHEIFSKHRTFVPQIFEPVPIMENFVVFTEDKKAINRDINITNKGILALFATPK